MGFDTTQDVPLNATMVTTLCFSPSVFQCPLRNVIPRTSISISRPLALKLSPTASTLTTKHFSLPFPHTALRLAAKNLSVAPRPICPIYCSNIHTDFPNTTQYEFSDGSSEVELRLQLREDQIPSPKDVHVDVNESSLVVGVWSSGSLRILMNTKQLYDRIKPGETIWYLDEDQLVINLKKHDEELKWPDIVESWESLTVGVVQLLKGVSIYLVGESTDINEKVARELAVGLGYTPFDTKGSLETLSKMSIDSWIASDGYDSVAEAERAVLENLRSYVRTVVATLGGPEGAAVKEAGWRYLYSGFTVWISQSEAADEDSAKEEARRQVHDDSNVYAKADVVVKLGVWDPNHAKAVAQASLSALKQFILSDKKLPGKKSLYIRLGCRGDWPNIKPPGWDPSSGIDSPSDSL